MSQDMQQDAQPKSWLSKNKTIVIVLSVVAAVVIVAIVGATLIRNEGERLEQRLAGIYDQSVNSLSTCLDQTSVAAQVTEKEYEVIKEIIVGAASARYADASTADAALGSGKMFSAIQENYPQIDQRSWQNLQTTVVGCRDEFQGKQDRVIAATVDFDNWRVSNTPWDGWIRDDFPSNELRATMPDGSKEYGWDAYDQITRVITVEQAQEAVETGTLENQDVFGDS